MNWSTKLRVVIDTNVFISGLLWGGKPLLVIQRWRQNDFSLLISPFLLAEIAAVLERFNSTQRQINIIIKELESASIKLIPAKKVSICRDVKDNQILDLCKTGNADYLVTGDKDLLVLESFNKTKILKPRQFLQLISCNPR